jgi:hypothetical protein
MAKKLYSAPFKVSGDSIDPSGIYLGILGLHVKEIRDANGDIVTKEYYGSYDQGTDTYSDLQVKESRAYTRSATGIPTKKDTTYQYYDMNGNIGMTSNIVEKYYSSMNGFKHNKKSREALVEQASMFLYSELITEFGLTDADVKIDDFQTYTDAEVSMYIKSNIQPLLDKITNAADNTHADYRTYMSAARRDTILSILNITYSS